MSFLDDLSFGFGAKLPLILQTEATECGLACLGMVAGFHGYRTDLATLRRQYAISLKGVTLANLIQIANRLELGTRALKLDLDSLHQLKLPCILHWDFNHFVVLKDVGIKTATIYDPAFGIRKLALDEISKLFTGVALELWPNPGFKQQEEKQPIKLRGLMGRVTGISRSFGQILLLALALEVFALVSPFFMQWVIDNVLVSADRDLLTTLAIGFAVLMLMQQAVGAIRSWVIMYMGTTLNIQWRANVFTHLIRLPVQYFEKRHLGDVLSRFGSIDQIQKTLTTSFLEAILDGLMTIVTLVMMFIYSALLGWIAVGAMCLYGFSRWLWYRPLRVATEAQIIHAAKQQSHFLETVRGVKAIKLFQRQDERRSTWLTLVVDQINADLRTQKLQLLYKLLNGVLFGIENILIIWLGAKLVMSGNFSVGVLMAFVAYKGQFDSRVSSLIDKFLEVKMLQLQGERLADIVLTEPEQLQGRQLVHGESMLEPTIEVVGLRFRYSEHEPFVLDGVKLKIDAGESVAIVGPSGCGKTTLMNVLLGILSPTEGDVLIGGVSIKQVGVDTLRRMVGTVLQDDVLFTGSIADNISFFDPQADQQWVEECAQMASIALEIAAMPMAYNTLVGDMGTVLSGGQKQRVLLARALYKRPKILFLDEATSHLDIAKEHEVNAAVKSLNITRVIVAHRPETIATATRVIVLAEGKTVQDPPMSATPDQSGQEVKLHENGSGKLVDSAQPRDGTLAQMSLPLQDKRFDSNDEDLTAFGAMVGNARMVVLGQQTYVDGNVLELKSRMVRYLHERMGFNVLAMESGSFDSERVGEVADSGISYDVGSRDALFPLFSEASQMRPLFSYLDEQRRQPDGLHLVGFDTQHTGRFSRTDLCDYLQCQLADISPELVSDMDWNVFRQLSGEAIVMHAEVPPGDVRARYFLRLGAMRQVLMTQPRAEGHLLGLSAYWCHVLDDLECQSKHLWGISESDPGTIREQRMANYLLWLANDVFPNEKTVVWTTNTRALRFPQAPMMGAYLGAKLGNHLVAVGFTGSDGQVVEWGTGNLYPIPSPAKGSFEEKISGADQDFSLIDLRAPSVAAALSDVSSWNFASYQPVNFPIASAFDVMIHARTIVPTVRERYPATHDQKVA